MGFLEVLTVVLVILKGIGYLHCSWWQVFIPEYISAAIWLLVITIGFSSIKRRVSRW